MDRPGVTSSTSGRFYKAARVRLVGPSAASDLTPDKPVHRSGSLPEFAGRCECF